MPAKDQNAVALGRKGGKARVPKGPTARMTPEQRKAWAAKMVAARRAKREAAHTCEDCGTQLERYQDAPDTGCNGWSCPDCGMSWDD